MNLPDDQLRQMWRSVQGPRAELTGPLIRYAGLVYAAAMTSVSADLAEVARADEATPPELYRCRICGTLWKRWQNGSYSLIENKRPGPCCDNAPMGEQIDKLWPK